MSILVKYLKLKRVQSNLVDVLYYGPSNYMMVSRKDNFHGAESKQIIQISSEFCISAINGCWVAKYILDWERFLDYMAIEIYGNVAGKVKDRNRHDLIE